MANVVKLKRGSGSDPSASDMVVGEPVIRTDTAELFFKKDDGSVAKVSGGGGGPDFKYLELRNAANNGAASYPGNDFTLVSAGTTNAISPAAANTLLISVSGVIQKPNSGTSTSGITGFIVDGSRLKWATNIPAAPDFVVYQESGGIGEPSDATVTEAKLQVSNNPVNGYFLSAQSGNTGGLTWAAPVATSCTGNSATATALATARAINGVNFDGTAAITVTAAAGTLSGNTLNSSVVTSSLTSLGDLAGLTVDGDATFTGANYNVLWDKSANALEFADNAKAIFGTGDDFKILHDGTDSYLDHSLGSGLLRINAAAGSEIRLTKSGPETLARFIPDGAVELFYNATKRFETTSTGVVITGNDASGSTNLGSLYFKNASGTVRGFFNTTNDRFELRDSVIAAYGNSQDLKIYHDGSNSYFNNTTGFLNIKTTNGGAHYIDADDQYFRTAGGENLVTMIGDGAVELYFDNSKKFETLSDGVNITGTLKVNGSAFSGGIASVVADTSPELGGDLQSNGNDIDFADGDKLIFGTGSDCQILHDGTDTFIQNKVGDLKIANNVAGDVGGDITIQAMNGEDSIKAIHDGAVELYFDSSKKFETDNIGVKLQDNSHVSFGTGSDFKIHFDGSNAYLDANAGNVYFRGNSNEAMLQLHQNGAVELYHNNQKKIETTSTGVRIPDSQKCQLGDGGDMLLFHNGTNNYIRSENGTLYIDSSGGEQMVTAIPNGAVELYYDNSKKLETTNTGATVTGNLTSNKLLSNQSAGSAGLSFADEVQIHLGTSDDLQIYHDGDSYVTHNNGSGHLYLQGDAIKLRTRSATGTETYINCSHNGAVELYHDNSKKLETTSGGAKVTGALALAASSGNNPTINNADGGNGNNLYFNTGGSIRLVVQDDGHTRPASNNTYDLGTTSDRWRNIYTNDLNLSNEGGANDVDGTWGSYTIQEGSEDLFLVNKRSGKKYKFNLTEVL